MIGSWLTTPLLTIIILTLPPSLALTLTQLRHRSIYQVLTDRFARENGQMVGCDTGMKEYCGGNWKGIEQRLGYIQRMGFDTGEWGLDLRGPEGTRACRR